MKYFTQTNLSIFFGIFILILGLGAFATQASAASIAYTGSFTESPADDGSLTGSITATLTGEVFMNFGSPTLNQGFQYTIANLPAGLTPVMSASSPATIFSPAVTLTLTGNATNNSEGDSISNLTITFLNAAFSGTPAASITDSTYPNGVITFNADPVTPAPASVTLRRNMSLGSRGDTSQAGQSVSGAAPVFPGLMLVLQSGQALTVGAQGAGVRELQTMLNNAQALEQPLIEDAVFGPLTQAAVRTYQADNGLMVDGIAGPQTFASLLLHTQ